MGSSMVFSIGAEFVEQGLSAIDEPLGMDSRQAVVLLMQRDGALKKAQNAHL